MSRNRAEMVAAGTCPDCGFTIAIEKAVNDRAACPQCGEQVRLTWTVGSYNGHMPCDDRCQYAQGPVCSCSCGGRNHRRGYIPVRMVPSYIRERDAQRAEAKKQAAARRAAAERDAAAGRRDALIADHPLLGELLGDRFAGLDGFADDMRLALRRGQMSDRQIESACRMVQRVLERDAEQERLERRKAAALAAGVRVPAGRVTFTGTIVKAEMRVDEFRWHDRASVKIVVRSGDGWAVWGTIPRSAWPPQYNGVEFKAWLDGLRGQTITLAANIKPADGDPLFGYFKRPHLVSLTPTPASTPAPTPVPVPAAARVGAPVRASAPEPVPAGAPDPWAELIMIV